MKYQVNIGAGDYPKAKQFRDWSITALAILGWILFIGLYMYWIKI